MKEIRQSKKTQESVGFANKNVSDMDMVMYAGAAGGGKTDALLLGFGKIAKPKFK